MSPMVSFRSLMALISIVGFELCKADVSLYMPGFDPQPLSVNVLGAGSDGLTTYEVVPGEPTGTWVGQDPAFFGTGTLVEGANEAIFTYGNAALSATFMESCTIANGMATCEVENPSTTFFEEENATLMDVQGGVATGAPSASAAPPSSITGAPGSPGAPSASPAGSPTGSSPTAAGSASQSGASPSPSGNGCVGTSPTILVAMLGAFGAILGCM
ncbi:hypothetical protein BV22DRAFT_1029289 [Leucogyrophana mollusca]|uniref:Uncharacterized protein n=1 Tax=Leucogyrophana mollusca TaxID=85980 RepID=A0ACB8BWZ7_9AGAM|nr:hypothetical protein BV22DRAFT_1029289 [Leucogyrophana mollusca]